ncbi:MAG: hypothetical protein LBC80_08240 [Treponema sp.]|jgi:tetratricopeptide (TPR) repeat protein|nr:hypothetical protein [Treponema sp.]
MIKKTELLRLTMLTGLIFLIVFGIILFVFVLIQRNDTRTTRRLNNFNIILREYDAALLEIFGTENEFVFLNRELDRLERNTVSVESWLSVLKRRRALSNFHPPSLSNYHRSLNNALNNFPVSVPIITLNAAALVKNSAITTENELKLRQWLPLMTSAHFLDDSSYNSICTSLHILLGDFKTPQTGSRYIFDITSSGNEAIDINLAALKILRNDFLGAQTDIQTMLNSSETISNDVLRFAAEYTFDFGSLIRSAEIFSQIGDKKAAVREADALYLAGFHENAKIIWNILAQTELNGNEANTAYFENTLYNLAFLAQEQNRQTDAVHFLETLVNNASSNSNSHIFGLIRYSRLFDLSRANVILQTNISLSPFNSPYIDLEINKRHRESWGLDRRIAETWLLLDRHDENENLHEWAAWHFFFQRRFDEIPIFIDRLGRQNFHGSWIDIYRALHLMNEGSLSIAEDILLRIAANDAAFNANWPVHANLGRIYDEQRSVSRAFTQYELAASKIQSSTPQNPKTASRIQHRIAKCFINLGRSSEAIRVLLYALDLDPENMGAQLELDRLFF